MKTQWIIRVSNEQKKRETNQSRPMRAYPKTKTMQYHTFPTENGDELLS
jgi:hypothetical protein